MSFNRAGDTHPALSPCLRALEQCCAIHGDASGKPKVWPEVECEVPNEQLLGSIEAE